MRVQDLIARLSPGCEEVYANDLEAYMNRKIPFHSWNKDGEASTDLDDKAKYYYKELFMRTETAYYTQDEQFIRYCGALSGCLCFVSISQYDSQVLLRLRRIHRRNPIRF